MASFISSFVTPAFVAGLVSLAITAFINARAEKLKANRDYIANQFQESRAAVSEGVAAAADYFPFAGQDRSAAAQTKLFVCERDVRCSLAVIVETGPRLEPPMDVTRLQELADSFIDSLTSDTFGQTECPASPDHAQHIASMGAEVRDELARMRQRQLEDWLNTDTFQRVRNYLRRPMGPLHYTPHD